MAYKNKYKINSTTNWKIPGDVPDSSRVSSNSNNLKIEENASHLSSNDLNKTPFATNLSHQVDYSAQRVKNLLNIKNYNLLQPLTIFLLIISGVLLSFTTPNNQSSFKGNESYAALELKPLSKNLASIDKDLKQSKNNHKSLHLKLTNKPIDESHIVKHIVVKGDTLWDIAEHYVKDPFRYPELAKLSKIITPDLIYPGNIIYIQT